MAGYGIHTAGWMVVLTTEVRTHGGRREEDRMMSSRLALELSKELEKSVNSPAISSSISQLGTTCRTNGFSPSEASLDVFIMLAFSYVTFTSGGWRNWKKSYFFC